MSRELDKWQIVISLHPSYEFAQLGWRNATVGVIKLTSLPPEGAMISKNNYEGVLLKWRYWLPWEKY